MFIVYYCEECYSQLLTFVVDERSNADVYI